MTFWESNMNNKMKLVIQLSGIVLLITVLCAFLGLSLSQKAIETDDKIENVLHIQTTTSLAELSLKGEESKSKVYGVDVNRRGDITQEKVIQEWEKHSEEIQDWQVTKFGYYLSSIINSDYDNYDIEALEQLGEQHDLKALDLLAQKYILLQDLDNAIKTYRKAAAFGSTQALNELGDLERKIAFEENVTTEQKELYRGRIKLSHYQAAILRGDTVALMASENYISTHKLKLTNEDKEHVRNNGIKIYNRLITERVKRGLPAFDNSMPRYIKDYYNQVGSNYTHLTTGNSPLFALSNR